MEIYQTIKNVEDNCLTKEEINLKNNDFTEIDSLANLLKKTGTLLEEERLEPVQYAGSCHCPCPHKLLYVGIFGFSSAL